MKGSPLNFLLEHYEFPFTLRDFQGEAINDLSPLDASGLYFEPGLGKTVTATAIALIKRLMGTQVTVVIMPPLLISQWERWLKRVRAKNGSKFKILCYRGSPRQREKMDITAHDFVLVSIAIFKIDYERFVRDLNKKTVHVILDEGQCVKDVGTANYKKYRNFVQQRTHQLLTGTPLTKPEDAYAYIKLIAPTVYRTLAQFNQIHIKATDFFGNPKEYQNLDLLRDNLLINAKRKTKEEALLDLPPFIVTPIEYELDPKHLALYRKIAAEQLVKLPNDGKIDLTESTALYHAMGQLVMQWGYFAQEETLKSKGYDLIEEVLDELGTKKLVVFANYIRTNRAIVDRYKCPGVWGEISPKQKQLAIDRFIDDPDCRLITLQPVAGGVGVDGLHHVCSDCLYVEPPITPTIFTQSLSRLHRDGQTETVIVRMACALGTIQEHLLKSVSAKDSLIQPLQGSKAVLEAALFGSLPVK